MSSLEVIEVHVRSRSVRSREVVVYIQGPVAEQPSRLILDREKEEIGTL